MGNPYAPPATAGLPPPGDATDLFAVARGIHDGTLRGMGDAPGARG